MILQGPLQLRTLWVCICKRCKTLVSSWNILLAKTAGTQAGKQSLHLPRPKGSWTISHWGTKGATTALKCFQQAGLWVTKWAVSHATHWAQRVRKKKNQWRKSEWRKLPDTASEPTSNLRKFLIFQLCHHNPGEGQSQLYFLVTCCLYWAFATGPTIQAAREPQQAGGAPSF